MSDSLTASSEATELAGQVPAELPPTDSGATRPDAHNDASPSLLDQAVALNSTHKMISKVTDGEKLINARTEISEMVVQIDTRIDSIRNAGRTVNNVEEQKVLYSEYSKLNAIKELLEKKLESARAGLEDLTDKQAEFFGLTTKGQIPTEG